MAWWWLVLLLRVLAPEAAMLQLHPHAHTQDEPRLSGAGRAGSKALLSPQHKHCHAEQLYDVPFQPAAPVAMPVAVRLLRYATYRPQAPVCRASHLLDGTSLRGPPASRA